MKRWNLMAKCLLVLVFAASGTELLLTLPPEPAAPQNPRSAGPLVHTFSIVARDPVTGEMGAAVQSHWFSVGSNVIWGQAGTGVVATQSFIDPSYGPRGLYLMSSGMAAPGALQSLLAADSGREVRQIAFLDAKGRLAVHTGARCIEWAGHRQGADYSVQANMMLGGDVVPAMAKAFEETRGDLAERLMTALDAGQAAGGDIRGRQSAAILVVKGTSSGRSWDDRIVDLRVDDHAEPLAELRRLLVVHRAYRHMNRGDAAVETGDMPEALRQYGEAARLLPGSLEVRYWHAITLATNGRLEEALPMLRDIFSKDPNWLELTRRLPKAGIIPDDAAGHAIVQAIEKAGGPAATTKK